MIRVGGKSQGTVWDGIRQTERVKGHHRSFSIHIDVINGETIRIRKLVPAESFFRRRGIEISSDGRLSGREQRGPPQGCRVPLGKQVVQPKAARKDESSRKSESSGERDLRLRDLDNGGSIGIRRFGKVQRFRGSTIEEEEEAAAMRRKKSVTSDCPSE